MHDPKPRLPWPLFPVFCLCGSLLAPAALGASDWPSWRGPEQNGVSRDTDLPERWSLDGENLIWKAPYAGRSAPVVLGGRVFITSLVGEGPAMQEALVALDAETGKVLWEHRFNVFLTDIPSSRVGWPNPAADPETGNVYVHGVQGLLKCLDRDGKLLWERSLTEEFGRISGYGGRTHTPVIDEDRLIISFLNSSWGPQARGGHRYLALDKRTGAVLWWAEPGGPPRDTTYSTPVVTVVNGTRMLIAGNADGSIYAMKARTGEKVWGFKLSKAGIDVTVVERDGLVYAAHSEENFDTTVMGRVVCIDATGTGDVTATHEKWRADNIGAGSSSPALDGDNLYICDDSANLHCFDAKTGARRWVHNAGTSMKASPVAGDGKIYLPAVRGIFSILRPEADGCRTLSQVAFSSADGTVIELNGSPAIAGGRVYFTTWQDTYAIGKKEWKGTSGPLPPVPVEARGDLAAPAAHLQVTPGDLVLAPGQSAVLDVRLFDAGGRRLSRAVSPRWSLKGLEGTISESGRLAIAADSSFQGGSVAAEVGGLTTEARVRVVPQLPLRIDFEDLAEGQSPPGWIGSSPLKFQVVSRDGSKVLKKVSDRPQFTEANIFFGLPGWEGYTLQADLLGTQVRRQMPDMGLIANRYELRLMGNVQRLHLSSWVPMPRVEERVRFPWKPDVWYRMKLRIDPAGGGAALVRGKVWPRDEPEPTAWSVELRDPRPNLSGAPGLHTKSAGTTDRASGAEVFFDNITVTRSGAAEQ
jgi:outer membrane protein assembly factor BamB